MIVVCRAGPRAGTKRMGPDATCGNACASPLEASSGRTVRHRLNRQGNRRLNRLFHQVALTQQRIYAPAQRYLARRKHEGRTFENRGVPSNDSWFAPSGGRGKLAGAPNQISSRRLLDHYLTQEDRRIPCGAHQPDNADY
jgi:hypothetical protein